MLRNQRADAVEDLVGKYPILKLPPSTPASRNSFDFSAPAELIETGFNTTRDFLRQLPELADSSPSPEEPPPAAPRGRIGRNGEAGGQPPSPGPQPHTRL